MVHSIKALLQIDIRPARECVSCGGTSSVTSPPSASRAVVRTGRRWSVARCSIEVYPTTVVSTASSCSLWWRVGRSRATVTFSALDLDACVAPFVVSCCRATSMGSSPAQSYGRSSWGDTLVVNIAPSWQLQSWPDASNSGAGSTPVCVGL